MKKIFGILMMVAICLAIFACGNGARENKNQPVASRDYNFGYSGLPSDSILVADFSAPGRFEEYPLPGTSGVVTISATHFLNGSYKMAIFSPSDAGHTSIFTIDRLPYGAIIQLDNCYISFNEIYPESFSFTGETLTLQSQYVIKVATDATGTPLLTYCTPGELPPYTPDGVNPSDVPSCQMLVSYQSGGQDLLPVFHLFQASFTRNEILEYGLEETGVSFVQNLTPNQELVYDVELEDGYGYYLAAVPGWETGRSLILNGVPILPENSQDTAGTLRFYSRLNTDCTITAAEQAPVVDPSPVGHVNLSCDVKYYPGLTQAPTITSSIDGFTAHLMTLTNYAHATYSYNNVATNANYAIDLSNPCQNNNGQCVTQDMITVSGLVAGAVIECWTNVAPNHVQLVWEESDGSEIGITLGELGEIVVPTCTVPVTFRPTAPISQPVYLEYGQNIFSSLPLYVDNGGNWSNVLELSPGRYEATVWFNQGTLHRAIELNTFYGLFFVNNIQVTSTVTYGEVDTLQQVGDYFTYYYSNYIFEITSSCTVVNTPLSDPILIVGIPLTRQ